MFSKRIHSIKESPIREFAPLYDKVTKEGVHVYSLNIGQPDIVTPKEYFKEISKIDTNVLSYTHSRGIDELLSSLENYYNDLGINFTSEDIIVTNGGSEAILFAYMALLDPGDEILVFEPYYSNYNIFAKEVSANITPITTYAKDNFRLPKKEDIQKKITNKTKVIAITNPSNPTGRVYTKEEIKMISEIALENNIMILADEVYREFTYDSDFYSFTEIEGIENNLVVIDSLSKRFSACGARIGCLASKNKEFMHHILKLCQARLCVPYIEQMGAVGLLKTDKTFIRDCIKEYKNRRDTIYEKLNEIENIHLEKPSGAFYLVVKLPVKDAYDFSRWLLSEFTYNNETVMLCPASDFYGSEDLGRDEVRIAYILKKEDLVKACKIIELGLEKYLSLNK